MVDIVINVFVVIFYFFDVFVFVLDVDGIFFFKDFFDFYI